MSAYERILDALRDHGSQITVTGRQARAQCPAHDGADRNLAVTDGGQQALLKCHSRDCDHRDILAAIGLKPADLYDNPKGATYTYGDGRIVHRSPDKKFWQTGNTKGTQLYRLDEVADAVKAGTTVYLVEGEKDVHALEVVGAVATTAPMGAAHWDRVDPSPLYGAHVVVVVDKDDAGKKWANAVSDSLRGKAAALDFVEAKVGKDAADHVAAEHGPSDFVRIDLAEIDTKEIRRLAFLREVAEETHKLRVRDAARTAWTAEQRGPVDPPKLLTLRDRLALPRPPTLWRIREWQPAGSRVVLAAQFKSGKTTLVGNLVRCLVDGDNWLGRHEVTPVAGTVVVLDFEMGPNHLDDWLRDQRIHNDDRVHVEPMRGQAAAFNLLDDRIRAWWAEMLRQRDAGYLVLDCLRPILDALGLDEQRDAGRFLVPLDRLLTEAGIADAIVVHHMGHTSERSRGDSRIRDWPDVEWRLVRETDDPASARYISAYGRDVDQHESQLAYITDTRHLTLAGGTRTEQKARRALVDVTAALDEAGEALTGRAVESALAGTDHSRDAIRAALKLGIRLGSVTTEPGPHRSTLHSRPVSAPVRGSAPPVRQRTEVSAPVRSIDGAHHGAPGEDMSARAAELSLVEPDCPDCSYPLDSDQHGKFCEEESA